MRKKSESVTVSTTPAVPVVDKGIPFYPITIGSWWQYQSNNSNPAGSYPGSLKISVIYRETLKKWNTC